VLTSHSAGANIIAISANAPFPGCPESAPQYGKKEQIMTSVFGFLVVIIIVSIIVIIVDGASRVLPKNSL
jgi:hypothetical protein